ncbi:MAG: hypothetical protein JXR76_02205 [Deltaproteobacteria bacterium]|nr:hypothetical protein [Deltaproteobacteria bacterium]
MRALRVIAICIMAILSGCLVDTDGYTFVSGDTQTEVGTTSDNAVVTGSDSNTSETIGTSTSSDSYSDISDYLDTHVDTMISTDTYSGKESDSEFDSGSGNDIDTDTNVDTQSDTAGYIDTGSSESTDFETESDNDTECPDGGYGETCQGCVVYVNNKLGNFEGHDGNSWQTALRYLQDALEKAEILGGCEIWVASGTYLPTQALDIDVPRTKTFAMVSGVKMFGGFAGTEKQRTDRNFENNQTILSGDIGTRENVDNVYHVVTGANDAILDGFVITGGMANGDAPHNGGGGMYNSNSSPTVENCTFTDNIAFLGGGMYNYKSSPNISNCNFRQNYGANGGGGVYNYFQSSPVVKQSDFSENMTDDKGLGGAIYNHNYSSPVISDCNFNRNATGAGGYGGAIHNDDSSPKVTNSSFVQNSTTERGGGGAIASVDSVVSITNCIFSGNRAPSQGSGGAIYNDHSSPQITNCLLVENSSYGGGGIYNKDSSPVISNSTLTKNSASLYGAGIFNNSSSSPKITNSILWGNDDDEIYDSAAGPGSTVTFSLVSGGYEGVGNIDDNPQFFNWDENNLTISEDSPCVDTGNIAGIGPDVPDLDGDSNTGENIPFDLNLNPRTQGQSVDMGAFETQPQ